MPFRIPDAAQEALDSKLEYWEKLVRAVDPGTGLPVAGPQNSSTTPTRTTRRTQCRPQFEEDDAPLKPQRPVDFTNKMSIADFDVQMGLLGPKLHYCSTVLSLIHGLILKISLVKPGPVPFIAC